METKSVCVKLIPVVTDPGPVLIKAIKQQQRLNKAITAFAIVTTVCLLLQDKNITKIEKAIKNLKQTERD